MINLKNIFRGGTSKQDDNPLDTTGMTDMDDELNVRPPVEYPQQVIDTAKKALNLNSSFIDYVVANLRGMQLYHVNPGLVNTQGFGIIDQAHPLYHRISDEFKTAETKHLVHTITAESVLTTTAPGTYTFPGSNMYWTIYNSNADANTDTIIDMYDYILRMLTKAVQNVTGFLKGFGSLRGEEYAIVYKMSAKPHVTPAYGAYNPTGTITLFPAAIGQNPLRTLLHETIHFIDHIHGIALTILNQEAPTNAPLRIQGNLNTLTRSDRDGIEWESLPTEAQAEIASGMRYIFNDFVDFAARYTNKILDNYERLDDDEFYFWMIGATPEDNNIATSLINWIRQNTGDRLKTEVSTPVAKHVLGELVWKLVDALKERSQVQDTELESFDRLDYAIRRLADSSVPADDQIETLRIALYYSERPWEGIKAGLLLPELTDGTLRLLKEILAESPDRYIRPPQDVVNGLVPYPEIMVKLIPVLANATYTNVSLLPALGYFINAIDINILPTIMGMSDAEANASILASIQLNKLITLSAESKRKFFGLLGSVAGFSILRAYAAKWNINNLAALKPIIKREATQQNTFTKAERILARTGKELDYAQNESESTSIQRDIAAITSALTMYR